METERYYFRSRRTYIILLNLFNEICLPIIGDKPCKRETEVSEIQSVRKGNLYTELVKSSFTLIIPCLSRGSLTLHEK